MDNENALRTNMILPRRKRAATLADAQRYVAGVFMKAGIEDGLLEAEILLRHALQIDRAALFADLRRPITSREVNAFEEFAARRLRREPTAYITGHRDFFSLDFSVTPDALIPRPETEMLVEATLAHVAHHDAPLVVDVGAGCGAIAVAVAVNNPSATVIATDASAPALALTRLNARRHAVEKRILALQADLLAGLQARSFGVVVANLPYVRSGDWESLDSEIREYEPRLALDGGPDGLVLIRRMLLQAAPLVAVGAVVYVEIGDGQEVEATSAAWAAMPEANVAVEKDFAGRGRMLVVEPRGMV